MPTIIIFPCLVQKPFKKSTAYALPSNWNELQPEVKYQENPITFKWALKAHLLESISDD
jgi:hypothetical protein